MVAREGSLVTVEEVPVEGRERAGGLTRALGGVEFAPLAVLTHPLDVSATGGVRLGHENPAVGVGAHTDDVRHHHPLGGIDELFAHPIEELLRVHARDKCEVGQHHEPWDVMNPSARFDIGHDCANAVHFCLVRISEERQQRPAGLELIECAVFLSKEPIHSVDVFPPANNLPNKRLDRLNRSLPCAVGGNHGVDGFTRIEQSVVEVGAEERVVERPVVARHGVFERTKALEVVGDEVVELRECSRTSSCPRVCGRVAELCGDGLVSVVTLMLEVWRPVVILGRWQAVVVVEVPTPTLRVFAVNEYSQPNALLAIEVLHHVRLLRTRPLGEEFARSNEEVVGHEFDTEFCELL